MPTSLRQALSELASSFAQDVVEAVRAASIDELAEAPGKGPSLARVARASVAEEKSARSAPSSPLAPSDRGRRGGGARLGRRSPADIATVMDRIAAVLRQSPKGLRAEQIRRKLGLQAKELPRPLKEGLKGGRLGKSGAKRATTYVLKGKGTRSLTATAPRPARSPKPSPSRASRPRRARGRAAKTAAKKKK
jgi:hypothetical protein